ncbi:DUF1553 domain-containing protein [Roseiconus nitratireducens]|uniref:DUF1553 domain-containing protein n=1 Tax=Roseiconus nitratireducens TaxID=2605748 RepID=A0A5M6DHU7_9BACT|nr:PSD1 and planctomycete cytochrome C domain-containing protein [Roseiconus nitratireducens]KAA5547023.1 DUF1553 domain-containing protein [Roseiconus nitratireducens]
MLRTNLTAVVLFAVVSTCTFGAISSAESPTPTSVRFNRDVRAILTDKCFACHGPDAETVEGGLRLDLRAQAVDETGVIVPGDAEASELVRRIDSGDQYEVMPPPETHKPLTDAEREVLRQWIQQGAEYEPHWAYSPMRVPDALGGEGDENLTAVIDQLIADRLDAEGITPAEPADRITLIRRLSLDLTGIPPTPEEVDRFVQDDSEGAYAALVDRLLASQRFGERMAIYWLDLVRYADTVGYHGDQNVSQSPYRDYVINAFNKNLPYDRFIREQLAGDLLPHATLQQQVASGYNRLNQTTEEGGAQGKEYLAIYFADRVRNVSQVFMGATMGCAQCHDHKYDPYTTRDFYSIGAFFADLDERGVYGARSRPPMIHVPDAPLQEKLDQLDREIADLESGVPALKQQLLERQDQWERTALERLDEPGEVEAIWVDDRQGIGGDRGERWDYVDAQQGPVHSGALSRRQQNEGLVQHLFQNAETPFEVSADSRFYAWVHLDPDQPPQAVMLQFNDGNWNHRMVWGGDEIPYGRKPESDAAYRRAGALPETGRWVRLEVHAEEVGLAPGAKVHGMAFTQFGGLVHWDKAGAILAKGMPESVAAALRIAPSDRTSEQAAAVEDYYLSQAAELVERRAQIESLRTRRKQLYESAPQTVVSKSVAPRTIRVLPRGNWMDDSGPEVQPAIPEFLGQLETADRATRLDLAEWLCRDDNPLTSRTMANRIWSLLFGRGICASVDDLGGQGTYPSYPDLLDALAIDFVQSGWDIKHLMRSIALSAAYRRSSVASVELKRRDPYNDLFARQGRFGLQAETVRDAALAISGLLVEQLGGPSVHPYQPAGYYGQLNFPRRTYQADAGSDQYRRGLYTHWQRTFLHPMLKAFDAPSREECTAARARSNTPLQALVLLNDPTFVEAARVFAERTMREGGRTEEQRIRWAYREAVSRVPPPEIAAELHAVYVKHRQYYREHPEAAEQLVSNGQAPLATDLPSAELAAWTSVARVLLNLHETITRY